jgi:hypothetical protein
MNELRMTGRDQGPDSDGRVRQPDEPQRPRVAFPFKLAVLATFCVLLMIIKH